MIPNTFYQDLLLRNKQISNSILKNIQSERYNTDGIKILLNPPIDQQLIYHLLKLMDNM